MNSDSNSTAPSPELKTAFVQSLTHEMLTFCGPIFITPGVRTYPEQMIDVGTYSLIDTGDRRLLVTCHHIWQEYLDQRAKGNRDAALCLNLGNGDANIAFASPEPIAENPDLDLVVFDFEPSQLQANTAPVRHQKDWFPVRHWPIPMVNQGDYVVLMGFPRKQTRAEGMLCTFGTQAIPLRISGVSDKQFYIFNEPENVEVLSVFKNCLGGLSGSPAYRLSREGASLAGYVKSGYKPSEEKAGASDDSVFAGSLTLTHACFLQQDGTLAQL